MAYSELIKDFARIRSYMRDFYVYGFKNRNEYEEKSIRSYDNERRRIASWLGDYMRFQQSANGKCTFLSVDSRKIGQNPLFKAFKTKTFTDNDILLHFFILDLLVDHSDLTAAEVLDEIEASYTSGIDDFPVLDESTIRKKLKEYVEIGILNSAKKGVKTVYNLSHSVMDLESWQDAIAFFTESSPLGVIGSYLQDRYHDMDTVFTMKHHFILSVLDSEILFKLALAMKHEKRAEITVWSQKNRKELKHDICPCRFFISTQNGRQYVLATQKYLDHPIFYRLDLIKEVKVGSNEPNFIKYREECNEYRKHVWGVSRSNGMELEHLEMTIHVSANEQFIIRRLEREKRCGKVTQIDSESWRFEIDTYDGMELLPWIRTFTGRIISLKSTNSAVVKQYYDDLEKMAQLLGGE